MWFWKILVCHSKAPREWPSSYTTSITGLILHCVLHLFARMQSLLKIRENQIINCVKNWQQETAKILFSWLKFTQKSTRKAEKIKCDSILLLPYYIVKIRTRRVCKSCERNVVRWSAKFLHILYNVFKYIGSLVLLIETINDCEMKYLKRSI